MQSAISYYVATISLAFAVGAMASWQLVQPQWTVALKRGKPVEVVLATPAADEPEPVEIELPRNLEPAPPLPDTVHKPLATSPLENPEIKLDRRDLQVTVTDRGELPPPVSQPKQAEVAELPSRPDALTVPEKPPAASKPVVKRKQPLKLQTAETQIAIPTPPEEVGVEVDELPRKLAANSPPVYPATEHRLGIEGRVILRVTISSTGRAAALRIETSSGSTALDQSAVAAVRGWRFSPAIRSGKAVEFEILVPVNFSIRR
jgi:protein TonB